jgi:AraC-like DNA-binding protein
MIEDRTRINIMFSCTSQEKKNFEPFVQDHALVFILNGKMIINDGIETFQFNKDDIGFISKNQLVKTQKLPQENKPFMGISIFLPKETLYDFSKEHNIFPKGQYTGKPNFIFPHDPFLKGFFDSIVPYFENPDALTENLARIKTNETIELLIKKTQMQNLLFNFQDDFKIDLEAYMNRNFTHNIPLEQFAKLTGRSISTFKRDFQEIFKETPSKWLIKKRLDLAHFLITKQNKKPVEVYYDVGFVSFAHFSRTFKAEFKINPSEIEKKHS